MIGTCTQYLTTDMYSVFDSAVLIPWFSRVCFRLSVWTIPEVLQSHACQTYIVTSTFLYHSNGLSERRMPITNSRQNWVQNRGISNSCCITLNPFDSIDCAAAFSVSYCWHLSSPTHCFSLWIDLSYRDNILFVFWKNKKSKQKHKLSGKIYYKNPSSRLRLCVQIFPFFVYLFSFTRPCIFYFHSTKHIPLPQSW